MKYWSTLHSLRLFQFTLTPTRELKCTQKSLQKAASKGDFEELLFKNS